MDEHPVWTIRRGVLASGTFGIKTNAGLILIDGAVPQAVRDVEANIRALGFSIRDVKLILSTEPHFDHAGGLAALARDSGATVVASAPATTVLRTGGIDPADPHLYLARRNTGAIEQEAALPPRH